MMSKIRLTVAYYGKDSGIPSDIRQPLVMLDAHNLQGADLQRVKAALVAAFDDALLRGIWAAHGFPLSDILDAIQNLATDATCGPVMPAKVPLGTRLYFTGEPITP